MRKAFKPPPRETPEQVDAGLLYVAYQIELRRLIRQRGELPLLQASDLHGLSREAFVKVVIPALRAERCLHDPGPCRVRGRRTHSGPPFEVSGHNPVDQSARDRGDVFG
jgi:hypothetical protein